MTNLLYYYFGDWSGNLFCGVNLGVKFNSNLIQEKQNTFSPKWPVFYYDFLAGFATQIVQFFSALLEEDDAVKSLK